MHGSAGAVRSDRFVSWDTFLEGLCRMRTGKRPADSHLRSIAARSILEEHASSAEPLLQFLVPDSGREDCRQFTGMVSALLPRLMDLHMHMDESAMPETLRCDIRRLLGIYRSLLDDHGYFEPSFELHSLEDPSLGGQDSYALFFPELMPAAMLCTSRFRDKFIHIPCGSAAAPLMREREDKAPVQYLHAYETSASELAALICWIENLLNDGVSPADIHVSLGDYENWLDALQEETDLRGIPAVFHLGRKLTAYPAGRFFHDLHGCIQSGCSLESVKKLLINRAYPWKLSREFEQIVSVGIRQRCLRNTDDDLWAQALARTGNHDLAGIWKRFTGQLRRITGESRPAQFRELILIFIDTWLSKELSDFTLVFDYALHRGLKLLETCESLGLSSVPGLFSLWLQTMQESRYVPQQQAGGVSFYPYGLASGIFPKWHALAGLSSDSASVEHLELPYVSEDFAHLYQLNIQDMSRDFLSCSLRSGATVRCSMARESFSGPALPPAQFVQEYRVRESHADALTDPLAEEVSWWEGHDADVSSYYPIQRAGLIRASRTHLAGRRIDLAEGGSLQGEAGYARVLESTICSRRAGYVNISATSLDAFSRCPFMWLYTHGMQLDEEDLLPRYVDARDEGIIIHDCLHEFFKRIAELGASLNCELADSYLKIMDDTVRRTVRSYAETHTWCISAAETQLTRRMLTWLLPFVEAECAVLEGWESAGLELYLSRTDEQERCVLSGRIDRLAYHRPSGTYAVIDYKRTSSIALSRYTREAKQIPSYQLPFYVLLSEGEGRNPGDVIAAAYYDVKKHAYKALYDRDKRFRTRDSITDEQQFASLKDKTAEAVGEMACSIREGRYPAAPGTAGCKACDGRMLCRRRYHVR